ncbi:TetR/AcrR family transcriptional regulator [Streptomyces sp. NPDC020755]|uniref:TetR/AcrR family transcriptional regulator n=1 Tax=Streptomyces sp. NPDC020755 TaxID=3154790 RepID=UPI0033D0D7BF
MNPDRRDRLRDAAVEVLARDGGRGLTHRAVDRAAEVPPGTTKNYFPTRDAVLRAAAERCLEQYLALTAQLAAAPGPADREGLTALFRSLLENVAGPGRSRLLAVLELQAEATRRPWLSSILDPMASGDFVGMELAQRSAGLPVTPQRAAVVTLALHAAIPHLLTDGPATLAASGLDDVDRFVRDLLDAVYPPGATARASRPPRAAP